MPRPKFGVHCIADDVEQVLAVRPGGLALSGLKIVRTAALAERLAGEGSLGQVEAMSDRAIESLARVEGEVNLGGVKSLSQAALHTLAAHKGLLWLDGVVDLDDTAQRILATHDGPVSLNGLKVLRCPELAAIVGRSPDQSDVSLNGLEALTPEIAGVLSRRSGVLCLNGVRSVTEEVAIALSLHDGDMYLGGLTDLSSEVAALLGMLPGRYLPHAYLDDAVHGGDWLRLHGIRRLTPSIAAALGLARRPLALDRLVEIDAEVAGVLVKTPGDLSLGGITAMSDEVAQVLADHDGGLWLDGLSSVSLAAAESLARHVGPLSLKGLIAHSSRALMWKLLGDVEPGGSVVLNSVTSLSVVDGEAIIAQEPSWVALDGLTELPDDLADVLVRYRGDLSLNGVRVLTPRVARLLATREGETWLGGLLEVDPEALSLLRRRSSVYLPHHLQ